MTGEHPQLHRVNVLQPPRLCQFESRHREDVGFGNSLTRTQDFSSLYHVYEKVNAALVKNGTLLCIHVCLALLVH